MDRTQIIIYIAFGLIYLIMRVIKNRNASKEQEEGEVEQPRPKTKPITFEDLLKELSGVEEVEKPKPQPKPVPKPLVREDSYDHPFAKTTKKKQNQGAFSYEDKPNTRFEKYRDAKPISLEDKYKSVPIKNRIDEFDSKYHKEEDHTMADDVRESLRSASDVKKAFVLAEVLQRKF
jgi:hypothetical protein